MSLPDDADHPPETAAIPDGPSPAGPAAAVEPAKPAALRAAPARRSGANVFGRVVAAIALMAAGAGLFAAGTALNERSLAEDPAFTALTARVQKAEDAIANAGRLLTRMQTTAADAATIQLNAVTKADVDARFADVTKQLADARAAVAAAQQQAQQAPPPPAAPDVRPDLAALAGRVAALEARPAAAPAPDAAAANDSAPLVVALTQHIADVERAVNELRNRPQATAAAPAAPVDLTPVQTEIARTRDAVAALEARVATAERTATAAGTSSATLVAAAVRLQDRARSAQPFAAELAAVRDLTRAAGVTDPALSADLDKLGVRAARGVASADDLARSFSALASAALNAQDAADTGWLANLGERLRTLVTVRRTGDVAGTSLEARIARAETQLARRDVAAAVRELGTVDGAAAGVLQPWLDDANARIATDGAAADVLARAATATPPSLNPPAAAK